MKGVSLVIAAALGATSFHAIAGQGVPIAPGLRFESAVKTEYFSTDNFYRTNDNEVDAKGFILVPELGMFYAHSSGQYALTYKGEMGEIDSASEDDYLDHGLAATAEIRPYAKHAFDFNLSFAKDHDDLGTVRTTGQTRVDNRDLDEWYGWRTGAKYTYGADSARLKWFILGNVFDKEYTTNEAAGARFLSRQEAGLGGGLTYQLTPKSLLLFQIDKTDIEYDHDLPAAFGGSLNGTLTRGLLGYRWLATAKTSGEVWFGLYERDFEESSRGTGKGDSWLVNVSWAPVSYSVFTLDAGQSVQEAALQGENFINRQQIGIQWSHNWSSRASTYAYYRILEDEFDGADRVDDFDNYGFGGRYELTTHYILKLEYAVTDRESDIAGTNLDFDRNTIRLSLNAVF